MQHVAWALTRRVAQHIMPAEQPLCTHACMYSAASDSAMSRQARPLSPTSTEHSQKRLCASFSFSTRRVMLLHGQPRAARRPVTTVQDKVS